MIHSFEGVYPEIHKKTFIAASADVIGSVKVEEDGSIWHGTVVRGDENPILIGKGSNVQDNSTLHIDRGCPIEIGEYVTIGHGCIIHGCKIADHVLVGMGSIILSGAEIGENTIIGAGSLVTQEKKIPSGVLCMGSPAKVVRELTEEEIQSIHSSAEHYIQLWNRSK